MNCILSLVYMSLALTWAMTTFRVTSVPFPNVCLRLSSYWNLHITQKRHAPSCLWVFVHSLSCRRVLPLCFLPGGQLTTHSPRMWSGSTSLGKPSQISYIVAPSSVFLMCFGETLLIALRVLYINVFMGLPPTARLWVLHSSLYLYSMGASYMLTR